MIIGLVSSVVPAMTAITPVQDLQTAQYGCWGRMNMKSKDRHRTQVVMQPVKFGDSAFSSLYKAHSESAIVRPRAVLVGIESGIPMACGKMESWDVIRSSGECHAQVLLIGFARTCA